MISHLRRPFLPSLLKLAAEAHETTTIEGDQSAHQRQYAGGQRTMGGCVVPLDRSKYRNGVVTVCPDSSCPRRMLTLCPLFPRHRKQTDG